MSSKLTIKGPPGKHTDGVDADQHVEAIDSISPLPLNDALQWDVLTCCAIDLDTVES